MFYEINNEKRLLVAPWDQTIWTIKLYFFCRKLPIRKYYAIGKPTPKLTEFISSHRIVVNIRVKRTPIRICARVLYIRTCNMHTHSRTKKKHAYVYKNEKQNKYENGYYRWSCSTSRQNRNDDDDEDDMFRISKVDGTFGWWTRVECVF